MDQRWDFVHSDDAIRGTVGVAAFRRGAEYALEGRVETFTATSAGVLLATVHGTGRRRYEVLVTDRGGQLAGQCSCPMARNCKHVAAVVLVARRRLPGSDRQVESNGAGTGDVGAAAKPPAALGGWQRWVAELATGAVTTPGWSSRQLGRADQTRFALQFEVEPGRPEHADWSAGAGRPRQARPRVKLRPLALGRSGRWVRTGAAWDDLADLTKQSDWLLGEQGRALARLHATLRPDTPGYGAQRRWPGGRGHGSWAAPEERSVCLDDFDRTLWLYLRELVALEVPFITPGGAPDVVLAADPAALSVDLTTDPADGSVRLRAAVHVGGQTLPSSSLHLLGEPVHGLFAWPWRPASDQQGAVHGDTVAGDTAPPATDQPATLLLAPFERRPPAHLIDLLRTDQTVSIPADDVDTFLHIYYRGLRVVAPVGSSDGSVELPQVAPPKLELTATFEPDHAVTLDWAFGYPTGDRIDRVPLEVRPPEPGDTQTFRDPAAEADLLRGLALPTDRLPQLGQPSIDPFGHRRFGGDVPEPNPHTRVSGLDTAAFVEHVLPRWQADENVLVQIHGEPGEYRRSDSAPLIELSTGEPDGDADGGSDWFDLEVAVRLDGEQVPFERLFTALAEGQPDLLLDSGTYFSIERPEFDQLRALIGEARALCEQPHDRTRLSIYQAGIWDELRALGVVARQSERWRKAVGGLLDVEDSPPPPVPETLAATLRPYQLDGYRWLAFLHEHRLGGILADDMGLGKTVQVLALICAAVQREPAGPPFLVVAPTSVVANWAQETARFAPGVTVATVAQTQARRRTPLAAHVAGAQVVITSYSLFRLEYDQYAALAWSGLILDEAQFVKNHQGKTYQCARQLATPFKLAVTGTPLENNVMELWALLSVVAPGLFPDPRRFAETVAKPLEAGRTPELLTTFRRRISPLIRRRTKDQVIDDLPAKREQVIEVALSPRHQRIYQTHLQRERQKVLGLIGDMDSNRFAIFRSLTLLRQLCLDPVLIDPDYGGVGSRKVDALLERLDEAVSEGHRALVFSQFTGFLQTVRDRLDEHRMAYCYLDGRTRDRAGVIEAFKGGAAPVFLISLKAGGFGLNLTEADYCFVLDPWWNPAVEAQAVDRTHRIGQHATVMVYRLLSVDTIEEKVMALKARKRDLFDRVVDEGGQFAAGLSADDVRGLLS